MSASSLQLTLRSRRAKYGFMFLALAAFFFFFAAEDFQAHRPMETKIWFAVGFLCTGGALFLLAWHRADAQMTIFQSGLPGIAEITAVDKMKFLRSGEAYTEVKYRYEPSPGQMYEGKSSLLKASETPDWKIGERGDIKFDPASPARSVWVGKGEGP